MSLDDSDARGLSEEAEGITACVPDAAHPPEHSHIARIAQQIQRFHAGPLPDPETLRAYDEIIPDGAERLMHLVESQSRHRQALETERVASDRARITRGQWMGCVLTALLAGAGLYLGLTDHDWLAAGLFFTTIGAVVTVFVVGNKSKPSRLAERDSG